MRPRQKHCHDLLLFFDLVIQPYKLFSYALSLHAYILHGSLSLFYNHHYGSLLNLTLTIWLINRWMQQLWNEPVKLKHNCKTASPIIFVVNIFAYHHLILTRGHS